VQQHGSSSTLGSRQNKRKKKEKKLLEKSSKCCGRRRRTTLVSKTLELQLIPSAAVGRNSTKCASTSDCLLLMMNTKFKS
jgi:hypothetical protein